MKIYRLVWAVMLLFLQGCASSIGGRFQALETVAKDEAVIYLYRTRGFVGSGNIPGIMFDNEAMGPLPRGGYMMIKTRPGRHNFKTVKYSGSIAAWSEANSLNMDIDLAPSQQVFLQFETYFTGSIGFAPTPGGVMAIPVSGGGKSMEFLTVPADKGFQDLLNTNKVSEKRFEAPAVIFGAEKRRPGPLVRSSSQGDK